MSAGGTASGSRGAAGTILRVATLLALSAAAVAVLARVHTLGQQRFFTIDEWQYGHATWLVSQGDRPYADFYEHHFPLSYVAHALLLPEEGSFSSRALFLRQIPFAYVLFVALVLGACVAVATRNPCAALLATFLPVSVGFGLMSAIEYRADNFGAFLGIGCLALLDANRRLRTAALAAVGGALAACSLLMTQKMAMLLGIPLALLLAVDLARRGRAARALVVRPAWFLGVCAGVLGAAVAAAAVAGVLREGLEDTVLDALRHEAIYPDQGVWPFVAPFLRSTAWTTGPLLAAAALFLGFTRDGLWLATVAAAVASGASIAARYPYNYVFLCLALGVCAVRGMALVVERLPLPGALGAWRPLLYLLPLALVPDQLAFVTGRTTNEHQLRALDKIERYTEPDDVVIDRAGGALFRRNASHYWHGGLAHVEIYGDYFRTRLVPDYRASRAPIWIRDYRLFELPAAVRDYFEAHYVQGDGSLFALGFRTPRTGPAERRAFTVDIVRAGRYHVIPRGMTRDAAAGLVVDGVPVEGSRVALAPGPHRVDVEPGAPERVVSYLPPGFFRERVTLGLEHSLLFEYD